MIRSLVRALPFVFLVGLAGAAGCGDVHDVDYVPPDLAEAGTGDAATTTDGTVPSDASDAARGPCTTTFRFTPPAGKTYFHVGVTGDWNAFATPGVTMNGPDASGAYAVEVPLAPGLHAYKLLLDGTFTIDPEARHRKYESGVDNSAVLVRDCALPSLAFAAQKNERPASGAGHYAATVRFVAGQDGAALDAGSVHATLKQDGVASSAAATVTPNVGAGELALDVTSLADGKYTLTVDAKDAAGRATDPLRLVFWIEPEAFDWRDGVLYMAMNDRWKNAVASNDVARPASVDPRASFEGGDLEGGRQVIASGALDGLDVRAIWFSPFHRNTDAAEKADDGAHDVTAYHGYWPTRAREVDPRLGGDAALHALVKEAHAHGIRVVMDFVVNHVHKDHEYFAAHPEWFRTGCTCGTTNCDWTAHRLDCLFAPYLPDVDWTKPEVSEQFVADAIWWVDTFDIDGFRLDAVKHVEDAAVVNLAGGLRDAFEQNGTKLFMTGETAMGWNDCAPGACPGNDNDYRTIARYIGKTGLDGQFDFVLYHAAAYRTFAWDDRGLGHADYWLRASLSSYPPGALMTPFIGSHDTPRLVTQATYRDTSGTWSRDVAGNKWDNAAVAPPDGEPYARHRLALAWLYGIPGVPLLYYGDEYGEWGGANPNNRTMWRADAARTANEKATVAFTAKLGAARRALAPLRRGSYRNITATDSTLVFSRELGTDVTLVVMSRGGGTVHVTLPASLPLATGTVLHDWLGGPNVTVTAAGFDVTLPARGTAYLSAQSP